MSITDVTAIVGAVVAVIALALSIYNFYIDRKDKQPQLVAKISFGFITSGTRQSERMMFLEVSNKGEKPVQVITVEIAFKKNVLVFRDGIAGEVSAPFELASWKSSKFWIPVVNVQKAFLEHGFKGKMDVRARFRDAIGNRYDSRKVRLDIMRSYDE